MKIFAPIRNRKIKFALIGCGRIAKNHFSAIQEHCENAELVDICDIDSKSLSAAVNATCAKGYENINGLLEKTNADIVVLTTPSGLHAEQAIRVAQTNRHVLTEKPMATKWHDALRMIEACHNANVQLFVVKQNRYNPTLQLLKRSIEKNRFGRIYTVCVNVFWTRPQEYYDSGAWRGTWELDGGALMNQASHYIDLLTWLVGSIHGIHAYTGTLARKIEAEDSAVVNIKWKSGALGTMNVTMLTYPRNLEGSITIIGEKGTVKIGGVAINKIEHWEFSDSDPDDQLIKNASYETGSVYGFGHSLYYNNVIKVLQGNETPITDGKEGLKSLEVIIAAYLSAKNSSAVLLPLNKGLFA